MRVAEYLTSDNVMNLSGILVGLSVVALSVYTLQDSALWPVVATASVAQLLCFILFISSSNRTHKFLATLFWIQALFITTLYILVSNSIIAILSIVWIVQAAELYGSRRASWLLPGSFLVFTASQLYHWSSVDVTDVLISAVLFGLFQLFALSAVHRAIQERQLREETAALNRELIATRVLLSQTATQSERMRIARDLHDVLGHHMTALTLNLEVAKHIAEGQVREKVEQSLALVRLLLGDLRTTVGELREDNAIDLQQSIDALISNLPNLQVDVDFSAAPPINDVELAETLLRCTQEGITNVLRHSKATHCRVVVNKVGANCILEVSDSGGGGGEEEIKPGNGLRGMAERVHASGGEISWTQSANGFNLHVELMMRGDR